MADEWRVAVAEVRGEVRELSATFEAHTRDDEKRWDENRLTHKDLYTRTERPQWLFVWVMGLMGTALGGLAMYAILGK